MNMTLKSQSESTQLQIKHVSFVLSTPNKHHLSAQSNTPNNRKDVSTTPSSRFLTLLNWCLKSLISQPIPKKSHLLSPALRIRSNAFETSKIFGFDEKIMVIFGEHSYQICHILQTICWKLQHSSLPPLFLMHIFLFTMIIWWPHPRFCLGTWWYYWMLKSFKIHLVSPCNTSLFCLVFLPISRPETDNSPPILSSWLTHNPWWMKIQVESAYSRGWLCLHWNFSIWIHPPNGGAIWEGMISFLVCWNLFFEEIGLWCWSIKCSPCSFVIWQSTSGWSNCELRCFWAQRV